MWPRTIGSAHATPINSIEPMSRERAISSGRAAAGVERTVYTSSVATVGIPTDGAPGDECTPVALGDMIGHYKRSKYLAEQVALEAAREGMSVVIVNPSTPIGPGDIKADADGPDRARRRRRAHAGLCRYGTQYRARGRRRGRAPAAFERGRSGERYILGGEDMSLQQILAQIALLVGRGPPRIRLPYAAVLPIAYLAEAWAALSGRSGRVTLEGVRMSRKRMFFSSAKAAAELGYAWRPPAEAFADAIQWFRERGLLSGR
jgi:dihydroflavonol-4-reductase